MKHKIIPNRLLSGPENPGARWDARFLMVLADLLDPEMSISEVADMIMQPGHKARINLSKLWAAANSDAAVRELAAEYGTRATDRVKDRLMAIFQELLRRKRGERRAEITDIESDLADLERRFGAEEVVEGLLQ